ncbi:unnamed protein product [Mesocestoides corti]|uniref:Dynein light chain n=2 Tax=Mesocestoides corti TaxID=53468 RepID=A0A0R3UPP5_MESCO|nr:unnamed protein product [Mesocestoides corti]
MADSQVTFEVRKTDMPDEMQQEAVDGAKHAFEVSKDVASVAKFIKNRFDKRFSATWHCIVGQNFAR